MPAPALDSLPNRIRRALRGPLPGPEAQNRMAPHRPSGHALGLPPKAPPQPSAVLIPIYPSLRSWYTILIRRTAYPGAHSAQIGFPGGKFEAPDVSLVQTALREAQEELGIPPSAVEILGTLTPLHIQVSNLRVLPVVGLLAEKPTLNPSRGEVEYCIHADLAEFQRPSLRLSKTITLGGSRIVAPYFAVGGEQIWGATAMIIGELSELY